MIQIEKKEQCSGCSACAKRCPKHAIKMEKDREGFYYPAIEKSLCVECGLCEMACPQTHPAVCSAFYVKPYLGGKTNENCKRNVRFLGRM